MKQMTHHDRQQQRIDVERDAMGILRVMIRYRNIAEIEWSREALEHYLGIDGDRMGGALGWLLKHEYIEIINGYLYWPTTEGERLFDAACASGYFSTGKSLADFRQAALTGMDPYGDPTLLKYKTEQCDNGGLCIARTSSSAGPALPSPTHPPDVRNDDLLAVLMAKARWVEAFAKDNKLKPSEVVCLANDGLIRKCSRCKKIARHNKDQTACVTCKSSQQASWRKARGKKK